MKPIITFRRLNNKTMAIIMDGEVAGVIATIEDIDNDGNFISLLIMSLIYELGRDPSVSQVRSIENE